MHTVYQETLKSLKFGEFLILTFWQNKVWQMIQVIKSASNINWNSTLILFVHYNKIIMVLILEIYCSFILGGFSLTIWPRFVKFVKLSLCQSFLIYSTNWPHTHTELCCSQQIYTICCQNCQQLFMGHICHCWHLEINFI